MKNKIINYFISLDLNPKKEILKISLVNFLILILLIIFLLFWPNPIYSLFILIIIFVINFCFYQNYSNLKSQIELNHENEFASLISYFEILISNKRNVYQSFNSLIPYSSKWMKDKIDIFLKSIDQDKSIKPFIDFSLNFKNPIANNVMLSIYQMVDQGQTRDQMTQFIILFEELTKNHIDSLINEKERKLDLTSSFPLIGTGLMIVLLMFSVLSILGDLINVI